MKPHAMFPQSQVPTISRIAPWLTTEEVEWQPHTKVLIVSREKAQIHQTFKLLPVMTEPPIMQTPQPSSVFPQTQQTLPQSAAMEKLRECKQKASSSTKTS
ncbi:hypothetical protein CCMA1212_003575 [Trichoderma ghanense]|uniref:Uncharacterized protein n=1 Tax=Trichoderma ghanense TaxID=65468 RepID=A0ABY2H877_9HYPO